MNRKFIKFYHFKNSTIQLKTVILKNIRCYKHVYNIRSTQTVGKDAKCIDFERNREYSCFVFEKLQIMCFHQNIIHISILLLDINSHYSFKCELFIMFLKLSVYKTHSKLNSVIKSKLKRNYRVGIHFAFFLFSF